MIYLLLGQKDGGFSPAKPLLNKSGKRLMLGQYWDYSLKRWNNNKGPFRSIIGISVTAVDWDLDGDLDLLLGGYDGSMHLCENVGSKSNPQYKDASTSVMTGKTPLIIKGAHAIPAVADWDGDGKFDLISGSGDGGVVWFRNIGTAKAPTFTTAQTIIKQPNGKKLGEKYPGTRTQVHVVDFDHDGDLDLLVGDYGKRTMLDGSQSSHGWVLLYKRQNASKN